MSSRRTIVERTIKLQNTGRTPVRILGPRIGLSDILTYDISLSKPDDPSVSEWGFERVRRPDGGWVVPTEPHLPTWEEVDAYRFRNQISRAGLPECRKRARLSATDTVSRGSGSAVTQLTSRYEAPSWAGKTVSAILNGSVSYRNIS